MPSKKKKPTATEPQPYVAPVPAPEPVIKDVTDDTFKQVVLESKVPVLVDFWAPWCGPCKMMAPYVETLRQKLEGKAKVVKVNCDVEVTLRSAYNITGLPTFKVFKSGEVKETIKGSRPPADIEALISKYL